MPVYRKTTFEWTQGDLKEGFTFTERPGYLVKNSDITNKFGLDAVIFKETDTSKRWKIAELSTGFLLSHGGSPTRDDTVFAVVRYLNELSEKSSSFDLEKYRRAKLSEIEFFKQVGHDAKSIVDIVVSYLNLDPNNGTLEGYKTLDQIVEDVDYTDRSVVAECLEVLIRKSEVVYKLKDDVKYYALKCK